MILKGGNALNSPAEIGRVVFSRAGRDKGKYFIIVDIIDEQYVNISDGDLRRLGNPKKKKIRHLDIKPEVLEGIKEKIVQNKKVFDAELRSALRALRYFDETR
jgi:ribosomal protein L14E/L6E/L27E